MQDISRQQGCWKAGASSFVDSCTIAMKRNANSEARGQSITKGIMRAVRSSLTSGLIALCDDAPPILCCTPYVSMMHPLCICSNFLLFENEKTWRCSNDPSANSTIAMKINANSGKRGFWDSQCHLVSVRWCEETCPTPICFRCR